MLPNLAAKSEAVITSSIRLGLIARAYNKNVISISATSTVEDVLRRLQGGEINTSDFTQHYTTEHLNSFYCNAKVAIKK